MRALLITGGHVDIQWAGEFVKLHKYDLTIAVDGGLSTAYLLDIRPDIIVGDFDTVEPELLERYNGDSGKNAKEVYPEVIQLKPEKDDTDTQHAMKVLIDRGVSEVDIIGGVGTRMDHTLLNIYNLQMAHDNGMKATMYDPCNKMYMVEGRTVLEKDASYGKYISLMQLTPIVRDVTLKGFKYNVEHYDFTMSGDYRAGCSNEFANDEATIDIGEGRFLVIEVSGD